MAPKGGGSAPINNINRSEPHLTPSESMSEKSIPIVLSSETDIDIEFISSHAHQSSDTKLLSPPFSPAKAILKEPPVFPAIVHAHHGRSMLLLSPSSPNSSTSSITTYIRNELNVSRLNSIHQYLWLAGLPRPARSLHRQELIGRQIIVTEQADFHLCWIKSRIFIKPLPSFLLHHSSWAPLAHDPSLYAEACGMIVSYIWLVSRESDLKRALDIGLLPWHTSWAVWTAFVRDFLLYINLHNHSAINKRYHYGELRVARLNTIFRTLGALSFNTRQIHQGFMTQPDWYTHFLRENFGWLVVVFGYIAIVLNAMQVGLNTSTLVENGSYQRVAYGFSTFAIVMPVLMFAAIAMVSVGIVWYNVAGTLRYVGRWERGVGRDGWDRGEGLERSGDGENG